MTWSILSHQSNIVDLMKMCQQCHHKKIHLQNLFLPALLLISGINDSIIRQLLDSPSYHTSKQTLSHRNAYTASTRKCIKNCLRTFKLKPHIRDNSYIQTLSDPSLQQKTSRNMSFHSSMTSCICAGPKPW